MSKLSKMKGLFGILAFLVIALALTTGLILYAKGYRWNLKKGSVETTGIITIRSKPSSGTVYINGEKKGETDLDITGLSPNKYTIKIVKEGFFPWEKEIEVKKEVVALLEAVLLPSSPSLKALTFTGVANPVFSQDSNRIVFSVQEQPYAGIWSLNLSNRQIIDILSPNELTKVVTDSTGVSFSTSTYSFSPDGKKILVTTLDTKPKYFLLDPSNTNSNPSEISAEEVRNLETSWETQRKEQQATQIKSLGKEAEDLASTLTNIVFSPDKTKFIGTDSQGVTFLYDSKPDKISAEKPTKLTLPLASNYIWYPDNKHLILIGGGALSMIETDGTNHTVIYTGNFEQNLVAPTGDGSKIIILTNLNSTQSKLPNLYAIELR